MPRKPRLHAPGILYHIISRGNNREKIIIKPEDAEQFINYLGETKRRYRFYLYAYVIMENHFHLLIEVNEEPVWRTMQSLLTKYSRYFNKKHQKVGHLFQGRYKGIICEKDEYLLELTRYIHLNPLRAGLEKKIGQWKWSGYREYTEGTKEIVDVDFVLGMVGGIKQYIKFMNSGEGVKHEEEYHPKSDELFRHKDMKLSFHFEKKEKDIEKGKTKRKLKDIAEEICRKRGVNLEELKTKNRRKGLIEIKKEFIKNSVQENGYSCAEVSRFLGIDISNVSRAIQ